MSADAGGRRLEELFHATADLPPDARAAALAELARDEPELAARLQRLLETDARAATPLDQSPRVLFGAEREAAEGASPDAGWAGRRVGRYRLVGVVARGGMGVVFEAWQDEPRRRVALKLMRAALADGPARRRFHHEAELLGRLSHPGIARVLEAGLHREGALELPWFALEFVPDAVTLLEHARRGALSLRARVELFREVCDAVHHGHVNGVIHRDLKPDNLLVDPSGRAKVIDFGVARATDADATSGAAPTRVGELVGTLQYMSPEQTRADPALLDARTDVYSLGVVLYELLCDAPPLELGDASLLEAARVIRETPPKRPRAHRPELGVDLEAITLKCLEKERERRYASAADLARDLGAWLESRPVEARVPGLARQALLFSRRHRAVAWLGAALLAALVAGTWISLDYALEADAERASAEGATRAMEAQRDAARAAERAEVAARREAEEFGAILSDAWQAITPERARTADTALLEAVLARAAARADEGLVELPSVEASLRSLVARVLLLLGRLDDALPHARRSLQLARALHGDADPATLHEMSTLGAVLGGLGEHVEAEALLRDVLERRTAASGEGSAEVLGARRDLAAHLLAMGRMDDAEHELRRVLDAVSGTLAPDDALELLTVNDLARVLADTGRVEEAGELLADVAPRARDRLGADHPETLRAWHDLAGVEFARGRLDAAGDALAESLPVVRAVFGEASENHATNQENLAMVRARQGRAAEALGLLTGAIRSREAMGDERAPKLLEDLAGVVGLLEELGERERARTLARELLERATRQHGAESPSAVFARDWLARHDGQP